MNPSTGAAWQPPARDLEGSRRDELAHRDEAAARVGGNSARAVAVDRYARGQRRWSRRPQPVVPACGPRKAWACATCR
jgi:hypothetical protein